MTIQMIPARNCILSTRNVRRTAGPAASLDELIASIDARDVLQNLIGFAIPKKRGKFEITAGGRRLAAVHALIEAGRRPADYEIPVFVLNDTSAAAETSLAENFQRLAMNPADECIAFRYFIEAEGKTVDDIAKRFGLTARFVEGRIRLAGLADEVFEALQKGEITLDIAQAFGTTSDVARQSAVYQQNKGAYYGFTAANIRRAMMNETINGAHTLAKLVGRDAYVAAGGRLESDLFADQSEEIWLDTGIVNTLAEAKMAEAAAKLSGYANVVPVLAPRPDYDTTRVLRPVQGERLVPTEAEAARLVEIEAELEALEEVAEDPDGVEFTDAENERVEALEAEAERLQNRIAPIDDDTKARATAFLVIGPDGTPTLHETVYVEPTATPSSRNRASDDSEGDAAGSPGLGKPLRDELAVQRTKLLGLHVANDPGMAIDLAIFLLADAQVKPGYSTERGSSLHGAAPTRAPFGYKPEGVVVDQLQAFSEALDYSWGEHQDICDRFDAFRALDDDKRGAWAGWTVARTLEPKLADEGGAEFHNHLGRTLGIDVAAWWRPTATNFFTRVRKGVVLDALTEIGGTDLRNRYASAKKGDLASAAEKLCGGTAIVEAEVRSAAIAWVPDAMLFGATGEPQTEQLVDDGAGADDDTTDGSDVANDGGQSDSGEEDLEQAA